MSLALAARPAEHGQSTRSYPLNKLLKLIVVSGH
jgi:hypothetical protein